MKCERATQNSCLEDEFPLQLPRRHVVVALVIIAGFALTALLVRLYAASAIQADGLPVSESTTLAACFIALLLGGMGWLHLLKCSPAGLGPILRLMPDGSAVLSYQSSSNLAEPVCMRFVWRGSSYIRLVLANRSGGATDWRLYKSDLNASQWRALCRWTVWLERGQTSS